MSLTMTLPHYENRHSLMKLLGTASQLYSSMYVCVCLFMCGYMCVRHYCTFTERC